MFQVLSLTLQLLIGATSAQAATLCHWLTVDLGTFEIGAKARRRACRWEPTLQKAAKQHRIDPDLLGALVVVESRWKPWAVSSANACGLTQVIPKWTGGVASGRRKWTCKALKQPANSLSTGARILAWWIQHRKGDIREGLCGYNAGFRTCKRAGSRYARVVLELQVRLKDSHAPQKAPQADN